MASFTKALAIGPTLRASAFVTVVRKDALAASETETPEAAIDEEPLMPDQLSPVEARSGCDEPNPGEEAASICELDSGDADNADAPSDAEDALRS